MKIILHIGMTKTGTTALQTSFFNARRSLLAQGVCYPDGGEGRENHRYLCPLFMAVPDLPRNIARKYRDDPASAAADAEALWADVRREVEKAQPKVFVLSSEYFFTNPTRSDYVELRRRLAELSDDIDVVLYVREPASRFAARVQQGAKSERPIPAFDGAQLQRELPLVEAAFGAKVDVRMFDRSTLVDRDIVSDFVTRSIAPVAGPISVPTSEENESISAEAAALLVDRDHGAAVSRAREALGFLKFRDLVRGIDDATPGKKSARLKPEIAEGLRRASTDLPWLRERYGLVFPDIDYAEVDGVAPAYATAHMSAAALLSVDPGRLSAMKAEVGAKSRHGYGAQSLSRRVMRLFGLPTGVARAAAGRRT